MKISFVASILFSALFLTSCASSPDDSEYGFTGVDKEYDNSKLDWQKANLTYYTSYPDPGSEECLEYNGCTWAGQLAYFSTQKSEEWIENTNIIAVHSDDWDRYMGSIIRVRQGERQIDARVYDMCSDSDCNGCCTSNSSETGFLIDMEVHTLNRFGGEHGIVEWACLDC